MYNVSFAGESAEKIIELSSQLEVKKGLVGYVDIKDGYVIPRKFGQRNSNAPYQGLGGVVDHSKKFIEESAIYDLQNTKDQTQLYAFGGEYEFEHSVQAEDEVVIYMGLANKHWGHFLVDNVQRCAFLYEAGLIDHYKDQYGISVHKNYRLVYAGTENLDVTVTGNYRKFFELLGIDPKRIAFVNRPTRFKHIIVPKQSIYPGKYIYESYRMIFRIVSANAMRSAAVRKKVKSVYFSRMHLNDPKDLGEVHIENIMREAGYTILYPEELSLEDQIYYWQTAQNIACINGTIPHNVVFASTNLNLYIFMKMSRVVGYQFTMDLTWGRSPVYIAAYKEPYNRYPLSVSRGPFWISITDNVLKFSQEVLKTHVNTKINTGEKRKYLQLCINEEIKYQLRGSRVLLKKIFNVIRR